MQFITHSLKPLRTKSVHLEKDIKKYSKIKNKIKFRNIFQYNKTSF